MNECFSNLIETVFKTVHSLCFILFEIYHQLPSQPIKLNMLYVEEPEGLIVHQYDIELFVIKKNLNFYRCKTKSQIKQTDLFMTTYLNLTKNK